MGRSETTGNYGAKAQIGYPQITQISAFSADGFVSEWEHVIPGKRLPLGIPRDATLRPNLCNLRIFNLLGVLRVGFYLRFEFIRG